MKNIVQIRVQRKRFSNLTSTNKIKANESVPAFNELTLTNSDQRKIPDMILLYEIKFR